jgi:hypothetical protein
MSFHHSPKIATDGLVLCLDAGNRKSYPGSGDTWRDLSGYGNDGTLINGPSFAAANGGSIVFNGTNYASIPFSAQFPTGSNARSMCAIFNANTLEGGRELFGIGSNEYNGSRSALWLDASGYIGVECLLSSVMTNEWAGINNWVFLSATYAAGGSTHAFKIFINGLQKSATTFDDAYDLDTTSEDCTVATVPGATFAHRFSGNISFVSLYNRELLPSEILQNYNALKGRFGL